MAVLLPGRLVAGEATCAEISDEFQVARRLLLFTRMKITTASALMLLAQTIGCIGADPGAVASDPPVDTADGQVTTGDGDGGAPVGDGAHDGGKGGADAAALTPMDVHVLRDPNAAGHPAYGTQVLIEDLIVTGLKSSGATHGFYAQHETKAEYGGVYIYVGPAAPPVVPGDKVTVTGLFKQFRGLDEIDVSAGHVERTGDGTIPLPREVVVDDVKQGGPLADALQSSLVIVHDVVASRATSMVDFSITKTGSTGELFVTSYVANDVGPSPFPATLGQSFASIRGVMYRTGPTDTATYVKLAPFSAADVIAK